MEKLYVISAVGKDQPGLVHAVTRALGDLNINIVDIEARSIRGYFSLFFVVDLGTSGYSEAEMMKNLAPVQAYFSLGLHVEAYAEGRRKIDKRMMLMTVMGADRPGIVAAVSGMFARNRVNIEAIKMIARGEVVEIDGKYGVRILEIIK